MKIQNLGKTRLHVRFGDTKHKLYVTKYSTCDDVIHSIVSKLPGSDMKRQSLAVFEQSMGVERMLAGGTRVLKIVRSWGCESSNFELAVKSKPSLLELRKEFRSSGGNAELAIDDIYKSNFIKKRSGEYNIENTHDNPLSREKRATGKVHAKISKTCQFTTPNDTVSGKQAILSRYISDVLTLTSKHSKGLGQRRNGDGTENPVAETSRDHNNSSSHSGLLDACRKSWELETETDNESDDESLYNSTGVNDLELSFDNVSGTDEGENELDMAFVKSTWDCDSDEGIDVTSINSGDLNTAFVGDIGVGLEDDGDDSFSDFHFDEQPSVMASVQVTKKGPDMDYSQKITFVKNIFQKAFIESEDDEMDSFMVSILDGM